MADKKPEWDASELAGLRRALSLIADNAPELLERGAREAASGLASAARGRLSASGRWGALASRSVRPDGPSIRAGGAGTFRPPRSPGDDPSYGAILFGAEYGMRTKPTMPGHGWKGAEGGGYGIWPTVKAQGRTLYDTWTEPFLDYANRVWRG